MCRRGSASVHPIHPILGVLGVALGLTAGLGGHACTYSPTYEGSRCAQTQPPSCPPGYTCDGTGVCRSSVLPIENPDGAIDGETRDGAPSSGDGGGPSVLPDGASIDRPRDQGISPSSTGGVTGAMGTGGSGGRGTGEGTGGRASGGTTADAGSSGAGSGGRGTGGMTPAGSGGVAAGGGRGVVTGTGGAEAAGSGGRGTGGTPPTSSGGATASGGTPGTGGVRGTGGAPSTGGAPGTGGAPACTLGTASNCGACGRACNLPHATAACSNALASGVCVVSACVGAPWRDCNGLAADGCEQNIQNDVGHCGACNVACTGHNATWACTGGACKTRSCDPGFADCNALDSDGCETDLSTDPANCGRCGIDCSFLGLTLRCNQGTCSLL